MTSAVRAEIEAYVAQIGAVLERRLDEPTRLAASSIPADVDLAAPTPRSGDAR
jgi:hypothetical protein